MCILVVCMCYASEALERYARTRGSTTPMRSSAGAIIEQNLPNAIETTAIAENIEWHLFGLSLMLVLLCCSAEKQNRSRV